MQVEHEALLQLAFLQENQDSEDFLTPNCQYIAVPGKKFMASAKQGSIIYQMKRENAGDKGADSPKEITIQRRATGAH